MPQCQFPVFCCFCVSEKLHGEYSRNWMKRSPKFLFFPTWDGVQSRDRGGHRGGHWRVSQHSKSKKFLRMRTRKPRSNLGDVINERYRWDRHTLEEIAQRKCSTEHGWCSHTSLLLLAIRFDPMPQVAMPPRDAQVRCSDVPSLLGLASMVER
jgi:hypothetical protein